MKGDDESGWAPCANILERISTGREWMLIVGGRPGAAAGTDFSHKFDGKKKK